MSAQPLTAAEKRTYPEVAEGSKRDLTVPKRCFRSSLNKRHHPTGATGRSVPKAVIQCAGRMASESVLCRHRTEQTPFIRHAFENVTAALFKRQSGACYEIANRL